ncbi:phospholipid scramblase 3-like isoform X2 [Eleutherodactylus coqui]|uniref:phospholipid scramblase 3-like isoform X2 n=1 Tax=Eleutherodactylus coqui TaxID=57060 RepID=UPI0034623B9E
MAGALMVPPGLQDLIPVSHFYINQTWNHTFQNYCTYDLIGPNGHRVYEAKEYREFCGPRMDIRVQNLQGYNILNLLLPAHFCSWESTLQVIDASGHLLGFVEKNWSFSAASFDILRPDNQLCLKVQGPGWGEGFMSDQVYQVLSADKSFAVGQIIRVWQGLGREMFTREDKFVVQFPADLEVSMKAILIACTLMIDLLDHERRRQHSHH